VGCDRTRCPTPPSHTTHGRSLLREWQYYIARTHSLRSVFLSIKGVYYRANVRGVDITWLEPWRFSQAIPKDVDYRVMQTFLDLYETTVRFVMYKLYHNIGLAYPPALRIDEEDAGGFLTALQPAPAVTGAGVSSEPRSHTTATSGKLAVTEAEATIRIATLRDRLKTLAAASVTQPVPAAPPIITAASVAGAPAPAGTPATAGGGAPGKKRPAPGTKPGGSKGGLLRPPPARDADAVFAFLDADPAAAGGSADVMEGLAAFEDSPEALAARTAAAKLAQFQALFRGMVVFINREVRAACSWVGVRGGMMRRCAPLRAGPARGVRVPGVHLQRSCGMGGPYVTLPAQRPPHHASHCGQAQTSRCRRSWWSQRVGHAATRVGAAAVVRRLRQRPHAAAGGQVRPWRHPPGETHHRVDVG